MDPRDFQRAAREHFAADNALRAAPEPTEAHVAEYVRSKLTLEAAVEVANPVPEEEVPDGGD